MVVEMSNVTVALFNSSSTTFRTNLGPERGPPTVPDGVPGTVWFYVFRAGFFSLMCVTRIVLRYLAAASVSLGRRSAAGSSTCIREVSLHNDSITYL
jgi:hypothetical protein